MHDLAACGMADWAQCGLGGDRLGVGVDRKTRAGGDPCGRPGSFGQQGLGADGQADGPGEQRNGRDSHFDRAGKHR